MKKIVKSLSLLTLLPVLFLGVTSCGGSTEKVKDVKEAACKINESIAATPTVYKQKAEKTDFFSLEAAATVNIDEQTYSTNNSLTAQLVVNPNSFIELSKEEPNFENLSLVESMYFNNSSYSTDGDSEFSDLVEIGVYDNVGYFHTKNESSEFETKELKQKLIGFNEWIIDSLTQGVSEFINVDTSYATILNEVGPETLAWLSEEIDSTTYVDTVGKFIFNIPDDPESVAQFNNVIKPFLANILDVARTNINTLFLINGDENSFSIKNDTAKTVAFLNSIAAYANEQASKTEGAEGILAPLYAEIAGAITNAVKDIPTYSVTLSLSFKDKAIVGFDFDFSFSNDTSSVSVNFSLDLYFEKIEVYQMADLDQYEEVKEAEPTEPVM